MRRPDQIAPAGGPLAGTAVLQQDRQPRRVVTDKGHRAVLRDLSPTTATGVGWKERLKFPVKFLALLLAVHTVLAPWTSTERTGGSFPRVHHLVHDSILPHTMLWFKGCYFVTNPLPEVGNTNYRSKWQLDPLYTYIYISVTLLHKLDRVRRNINRGTLIVPYLTLDKIRANPPGKGNAAGVRNQLTAMLIEEKSCYPGKGNESGGNIELMGSM